MTRRLPFERCFQSRTMKIMTACVLLMVLLVAVFDWNWLRRPLERYLIDRSGREVRIGALHIDFGFSLTPTVRLRDLHVQNAPWAAKEPLIVAREVSFT